MAVPNKPSRGQTDWDVPLNNALDWLDEKIDSVDTVNDTNLANVISSATAVSGVQLNTSTPAESGIGKITWDPDHRGPQIGLGGGQVTMTIGQEDVTYVRNADTVPLTDGMVVYISGGQGGVPEVKRASNLADSTSGKTFGVVTEPIAANGFGFVTNRGIVNGLELGDYEDGDIVWLADTPGGFTGPEEPVTPQHSVFVGVVIRANDGNGALYVRCQNGYEVGELHDVKITNLQDGDVLKYSSSLGYWMNGQP